MSGAVGARALWYLTRGTGLVSLVLLTMSVVLGIVEARRWSTPGWPRFLTAGLHKNVSLLVTAFLAVHIATAVGDSFAPIGWLDVIVPFRSPYRPVWLGLGAVATDLLIALIITSLLRQRLGYRAWRVVHWAAYACWPVALVHGLGTGTDVKVGWVLVLSLTCVAAVVGALTWRLAGADAANPQRRAVAAGAVVAVTAAVATFLLIGPLQAGWARRAGTPRSLLVTTASAAQTTDSALPAAPFTASLQGTLSQGRPDASGATTVRVEGALTPSGAHLSIVLQGPATAGGGVQMQRSAVTLGPATQPGLYQGQVTQLAGTQLAAVVHNASGSGLSLSIRLQIDQSNAVTGTVDVRSASTGSGG